MVTFTRPFTLSSIHGPQPPGTYWVDTEDEEVVGLFLSFTRCVTRLTLPPTSDTAKDRRRHQVDASELADVTRIDRGPSPAM